MKKQKSIKIFRSFEEAEADQIKEIMKLSPADRLFHVIERIKRIYKGRPSKTPKESKVIIRKL